jgi:hypothetical protein
MDGNGRASVKVLTERLWRRLTYEEAYLHHYQSPKDAVPSTRGKPEAASAAIDWTITCPASLSPVYPEFYSQQRLNQ